jgi:peptide/nickel transport system substrate-binding protein
VYESLVERGKKLEIVPALAVSWKQTSPTVWIFNLRKGVKFHDGSDFTADDVVFSIKRLQGKTSNFRVYGNAVGEPRKIDNYTVELTTPVPNPVMLEMLANSLFMMSKKWCEAHNAGELAGLHQQGGELHRPQRHGNGAVHPRAARPGREEHLQEEPELVGPQGEALRGQRGRDRLHAGEGRPTRACRRCSAGTSTSCSIPRSRTSTS